MDDFEPTVEPTEEEVTGGDGAETETPEAEEGATTETETPSFEETEGEPEEDNDTE
jgi:hypothetical protein